MSSKRKTIAMLDSSSGSDSDLSESEFQTLAKKRKKSPQVQHFLDNVSISQCTQHFLDNVSISQCTQHFLDNVSMNLSQ